MEGKASSLKQKIKPLTEGGGDPAWDEELYFMVVDHYKLKLDCYDYDPLIGENELVGSSSLSILPVLQKCYMDVWVHLQVKNQVS